MSRSYKLVESIQSNLTEKINKDNAEINKAIANPNLGKNKDKLKAAGYTLDQTDDGKVFVINNPKTGRWIDPSRYNKDEKSKVDFKGKLDTERKRTQTTARRKEDTAENRIPKSLKVGKDKYGNDLYNREDTESYSPNYRDDAKKSTSDNINNYKKAIKTRDKEKEYADHGREGLGYYEKKVADAQKDLDWHKDYIANADKKSADAEAQRKAIIDKIRNRKTNESVELNESNMAAYTKVEEALIMATYMVEGDDLQELLQNVIGLCREIADDKDLFVESANLNEDLIPVSELPDMCYGVLPTDCSIIIIKKGETGYFKTNKGYENEYADIDNWEEKNNKADEVADRLNAQLDVTPEQRLSMELRSMNGNWDN